MKNLTFENESSEKEEGTKLSINKFYQDGDQPQIFYQCLFTAHRKNFLLYLRLGM